MLDPLAAASLRKLFNATTQQYPHLIGEAEIVFKGKNETKCTFKTKTPAETAEVLQHIVNNETGIFKRTQVFNTPTPLYFRMYKRQHLSPDYKEACLIAFNFSFYESDKAGALWLSDPEMDSYHWQGDDKIENKAPFNCPAPSLLEVIDILRKAEGDWQAVNFMNSENGPKLKLVSHKP